MDERAQETLFKKLFSPKSLFDVYSDKFSKSAAKGIDRINGMQYSSRARKELKKVSEKCLDGSFRFTPYLEKLKSKGRGKSPRVISIPTIRDRIVLKQLNVFLCEIFPDCVPKSIASTYIRNISDDLKDMPPEDVYVCSCDIEGFYDNINKHRLKKILSKRVHCKRALDLIVRSLLTPTTSDSVNKKMRKFFFDNEKGVPQGLSISNILAAIYLQSVDDKMLKFDVAYYRYVDDVLIYGNYDEVNSAYHSLRRRLKYRGLNTHPPTSSKTRLGFLNESFSFLGYVFNANVITVRDSTVESFIKSIASRFSDYLHNKNKRLKKYTHLTVDDLKDVFLEELNDKLTGAISEKKRYGWVAYYSNITDHSLLHKIDFIIREMFKRLDDFDNCAPEGLKKVTRAYYEMKYSPHRGYIRDYDQIKTVKQKTEFLHRRGRIAEGERLTKEQVEERYERYKAKNLASMHADEGEVYPK
ncbi:TPA: maturase [Escherichia coli]|nr:maturase [Escherichia coli]